MNLSAPQTQAAIAEALYDVPTGEMGRELERALAERVCQECGRPITRHVYPYRAARGEGKFCDSTCAGRAGGKAGRGESKSRSVELRAYHQARREGRLWAD